MNEQKFRPDDSDKTIGFEEAYQQLQEIMTILNELGLDTRNYCYPEEMVREQWNDKFRIPFPLASDGGNGIRASRRYDNNGFTISFTNGFEDPKDQKRMEITEALKTKGFDVI